MILPPSRIYKNMNKISSKSTKVSFQLKNNLNFTPPKIINFNSKRMVFNILSMIKLNKELRVNVQKPIKVLKKT